jgi:hypothetical protein
MRTSNTPMTISQDPAKDKYDHTTLFYPPQTTSIPTLTKLCLHYKNIKNIRPILSSHMRENIDLIMLIHPTRTNSFTNRINSYPP